MNGHPAISDRSAARAAARSLRVARHARFGAGRREVPDVPAEPGRDGAGHSAAGDAERGVALLVPAVRGATCQPPFMHITLNGALTCECGAEKFDAVLAEMLMAGVELAS